MSALEKLTVIQWATGLPYGFMFLFGGLGNLYVTALICASLWRSQRLQRPKTSLEHASRSIRGFLLALTVLNMLTLVTIPLILGNLLNIRWDFGLWTCKFYRTLEHGCHLLIALLMTGLSAHRYVEICRDWKEVYLFRCLRKIILFIWLSIIVGLLAVIFSQSELRKIESMDLHELLLHRLLELDLNETQVDTLLQNNRTMEFLSYFTQQLDNQLPATEHLCHFSGTDRLMEVFVTFGFLLGCVLPFFLLAGFYSLIWRKLRQRSRTVGSAYVSQMIFKRAAQSIVRLNVLYFSCWLPYWALAVLVNYVVLPGRGQATLIYITCFIHMLPYLYSAVNPYLFLLMNRSLSDYSTLHRGEQKTFISGESQRMTTLNSTPPHPQMGLIGLASATDSTHLFNTVGTDFT